MSKLGKLIDQVVESDPELMAKVAEMPFADLMQFHQYDNELNCFKGCLVGNMLLADGYHPRNHGIYKGMRKLSERIQLPELILQQLSGHAPALAFALADRYKLGRKEANDLAVKYITNRIRRRLMMMELEKQEAELQHA